jgi:hypothetical protein
LEEANKRVQVALPAWCGYRLLGTIPRRNRAADLLHDESPPQAHGGRMRGPVVDEIRDEAVAPQASDDLRAELGIERDRSVQQE